MSVCPEPASGECYSMKEYMWLSDDDWNKLVGQFRMQVGETLSIFNMYGMGDWVGGAVEEIVELFVDGTQKVRGMDKPYSKIKRIPRRDR